MKFSAANFLTHVRNIITGGGVQADGVTIREDAGFLHDMNFTLNDLLPAVTDSSGGTVGSTIAANAFKQTVIIPVQDVDLVNSATWKINMPFAGSVTAAGVRTGKPGAGASASATLTTGINGTPTTGGVITMTLASQSATGVLTAGTAISALNTFTAGQTLEFAVSGVTVFTSGDAYIEFTVVNSDLANAVATLNASVQLTTSETNLKVFNSPANTTTVGTVLLAIPRDYDEATDSFALHVSAASAGATDAPQLSAVAYRKRPGAAAVQVGGTVTAKLLGGTAATPLSSAAQELIFNFSRNGLKKDDAITITITSAAHTTDAVLVYSIEPVYRSTLVSYNETDDSLQRATHGNPLR